MVLVINYYKLKGNVDSDERNSYNNYDSLLFIPTVISDQYIIKVILDSRSNPGL